MKMRFSLGWMKNAQPSRKCFKSPGAYALLSDYVGRIAHFMPCEAGPFLSKRRCCVWVCEREKGSRAFSSEALARELQKVMNSGVQELQVVIGGPRGVHSGGTGGHGSRSSLEFRPDDPSPRTRFCCRGRTDLSRADHSSPAALPLRPLVKKRKMDKVKSLTLPAAAL